LSSEAYLEADSNDSIIADIGAGVYETKDVVSWTYSTQTAVISGAYGGDPATNAAILKRTKECKGKLTLKIEGDMVKDDCMQASYGAAGTILSTRNISIDAEEKFKSFYDLGARDNSVAREILIILGDTSGNIIAVNITNAVPESTAFGMDELMTNTTTFRAIGDSVSGDDELFITFL